LRDPVLAVVSGLESRYHVAVEEFLSAILLVVISLNILDLD